MSTKSNSNISVVIASLGGKILIDTIKNLNNSSVCPDEIIVVIPKDFKDNIPAKSFPNLRYELVPFKGQVAQRAYGFKIAKYNFVLQLDDDIYLDPNCIENLLLGLINLGPNHSVGPSIFFKEDGLTIYPSRKSFFNLFLIFNNNKMGTISKFGSPHGFDFDKTISDINSTEWLAGGCVLHYKNSLILNNFFPFTGKAYGEDLIHSVLLSNNGVSLCNVKSAICYIDKPVLDSTNYNLRHDFRSRCYLNDLRGESILYVYFWFFSRTITNFISMILSAFLKKL